MNPFVPEHLQQHLLLASASPRRREILENLGFEFEIIPTGVDEDEVPWHDPVGAAKLLAEIKAVEAQRTRPRKTIIGADTIVLCEGVRMGKPVDDEDARGMLERLSGRPHEVVTGLALVAPPNVRIIDAERTTVVFREISAGEIGKYIATGEPFDKAGAYAIQGYASAFVDRIEGCYFNVVGLPVALLMRMFKRLGSALPTTG
jgi:septum formation protein